MLERFFKSDRKRAQSPAAGDGAGTLVRTGLQHHQVGRLEEAEAAYREALALEPQSADALHFLGVIAYQRERDGEAAALMSRSLAVNAANAPAHNNLGNALSRLGRSDEAIASYERAIELQPDYLDARLNLAKLLRERGKPEEAARHYRRATELAPDSAQAHFDLGLALHLQGRRGEAVPCYERAVALRPDFADAWVGLGAALRDAGEPTRARSCLEKALALEPDSSGAHANLGAVLMDQGRVPEAIASLRTALSLDPDSAETHSNLASAWMEAGDPGQAAASARRALELKPDFAGALANLGNALKGLDRREEALACYRRAAALEPRNAQYRYMLGDVLAGADRREEALECFAASLSLDPEYAEARWASAMFRLPAVCGSEAEAAAARDAFSRALGEIEHRFGAAPRAGAWRAVGAHQPFYLAYHDEDNRALLERYGRLCAGIMRAWSRKQGFAAPEKTRGEGPIRVAVVSAHFRNHSVWNAIMKGWFENLDRRRVVPEAFHLGTDRDAETEAARSLAAHFTERAGGLRQWVEAIADRRPDVVVFPDVGMHPLTVRLASLRLAPVQAVAWGHPETTGLPTIDYFLSAQDMEADGAQSNYTERLVALPHLGCCYQPAALPAGDPPDLGGAEGPVLVCPGVPFKYAPRYDRLLVEIARRLGRCRLVFFSFESGEMSEKLRRRLAAAFAGAGLRFDDFAAFLPWQSPAVFRGLLARADVFLDTLGFSGFNTAMQAVEGGLPLVTREGRFLRGNLAAGILRRIGLAELVAGSGDEYVRIAVRLSSDAAYRKDVRARIEARRGVLFGDLEPVRALEAFLEQAVRR